MLGFRIIDVRLLHKLRWPQLRLKKVGASSLHAVYKFQRLQAERSAAKRTDSHIPQTMQGKDAAFLRLEN